MTFSISASHEVLDEILAVPVVVNQFGTDTSEADEMCFWD